MPKSCEICGKGPSTGHNVSKAKNRTKRRWLPNLQRAKVLIEGRAKRINICTRCLRSGKITKVA